jgi:cytochrome c
MKKVLIMLFATAVFYSCGNNEGEKKTDENKQPDTTAAATEPSGGGPTAVPGEKGLELIGSNDCMTCHGIDKKIVGPAYKDVAKKYDNTDAVVDTLVSKIKKGGSGHWGTAMMTPHPDLSDADAKEMVKYILSLKNK